MGYKSKYKGSEIDSLLDKSKNDYNVKQYADYAGYNADTSRPSNTISLIQQDQSIVVGGKRYSQNAECYVGSDAEGVDSAGVWYLCGEATIPNLSDLNIIGSAQVTNGRRGGGLFLMSLRADSVTMGAPHFQWLTKNGNSIPTLRLVISGTTVKLYCKVYGGRYIFVNIRFYNQVVRTHNHNKQGCFKLANSTTIIPDADVPNGTDIADVPYITTTAANNKFLPILATTSLVQYNPNVGYIKFAEIDTKGQFGNKAIILSVSTTFTSASNWNDGLYMLNIRGNGTSVPTCRAYCFVQYREEAAKIQLYFASSGSKIEFYREVRAAKEFSQLGFKILSVENFEGAKNWDFKLIESSKITSDATLDTPIGTLTEIPNRGQAYITDNALKIQQVRATANATRRLLLGEAHDTTQYDTVYKSPDLTYNPSTKTLTVPTIKNANGSWVHIAHNATGTAGYLKVATITINQTYPDEPIYFEIMQRQQPLAKLRLQYATVESRNPPLSRFEYQGTSANYYYLYQTGSGVWDLYVRRVDSYAAITVSKVSIGGYSNGYYQNPLFTITWQDELVTAVPEGSVAATKATEYVNISGNAASANKLVTSRKIGFANFDGTADLSLNNIQGANTVRWSSSDTLKPNQWIRLIRMKFSQTYSSVSITLAIEEGEQHRFRGLINFTAWVGGDITPYVYNSRAVWYSLYQVDRSSFGDVTQYIRMVPVAPTDNDANGYVDVYVMSPLGAISYGWHVINDRQVNNASFTLKADTTAIIDNENFPTSYKSSGFQGVLATGDTIEYGTWVTKATNATNADVANKTKYPIVFKRNGASITNWFAKTTFTIDIPEELLDYSSPTGITLKVPDEAKKVANDLEIRVNGKQKATFDGSSAKTVNIEASRSHFVKASMYGEKWTSPPAGATTPGIPLILDTSYMIPFGTLQDGDTIIMQVPNTLTSTLGYPVYLRLDTTQGNVAGNLVKIIKGQNAGNPVEWEGTTALTAGYYHFVYSEGAGGLIFMYRNVSTS